MKTYWLSPINPTPEATDALNKALPGQAAPWLLKDASGDVIAYFNLGDIDTVDGDKITYVPAISADVSGRRHNEDAAVITIMQQLQTKLGGRICNDGGKILN